MARKLHQWTAEGAAGLPPVVKAVAVVVGAFLVTGLLYFAAQQAISVTSRRVGTAYAPRYTQFDENGGSAGTASGPFSPTFAAPLNGAQQYGGGAPSAGSGRTGGVMRFTQAAPTTLATPAPPAARDAFTNDGERQAARVRVKALRGTLGTLRQYDGASLWEGVALIEQARRAEADALAAQSDQSADGSTVTLEDASRPPSKFTSADEAAQVRLAVSRKILSELEAMNAEVGLSAHPGRFPDPLHDGATAVGTAMRTYLETARMAVARPHEASVLKARAGKELARVEELIRAMELPTSGGASAAN